MIYYENLDNHEIVYEDDCPDYAMHQLGINIEPQGIGDTYTLEQKEFIDTFTDWYFGDNCWTKKKEKEDADIFAIINESCRLDDWREIYG